MNDHTIWTPGRRESVGYLIRLRNMVDEVLALAADMDEHDLGGAAPITASIDMLLDDTHDDDPESPAHSMTEDEFTEFVGWLRDDDTDPYDNESHHGSAEPLTPAPGVVPAPDGLGQVGPVRRAVEFTVPVFLGDLSADTTATLQAEVVRVLDTHAIVERVIAGHGAGLIVDVTFANAAEVDGLVRAAHNAALRVVSCDVRVIPPKRRSSRP